MVYKAMPVGQRLEESQFFEKVRASLVEAEDLPAFCVLR
jgi:hypothetical protein